VRPRIGRHRIPPSLWWRRRNPHRISLYEVVGYTSALLLAAAIAFGWFDLMIPWGS
jgi:cellulose synthase (UDP-forming)